MSSRDAGGSFDMDVHFTITTLPSRPHLVNSVRGLVFTNGNLGGICAGAGPCAIAVQDMPAGFYEVRILLMDSQWLEGSDKAYECSERQHSCIALLAMESYKVNFFHVTLLSTVVDPFSPMLEQSTVNPHGRPSSLVLENTYEVNDEGDVLSDLLVSDGGKQVTFVSPLVPRPNEINAIRESSWECRFQGLDQASVGTVSSDGAHTYRISCPVPDSLPSFQTGASVAVGVFRDGDAIAPENVFRKPEQMRLPTESAGPAPVEICTMVRNEEAFVVEWVEYHLMLGVAHIHIYLHLTSDSAALLLEPYVQRGQVTLRAWDFNWSPMYMRFQSHAWNDCAARTGASSLPLWVSILDVDEFLVPGPQAGGEGEGGEIPRALHRLATKAAAVGGGGGAPSAVKLAWLPFSSRTEEEEGGERALTVERFRWHAGVFEPEVGRMIGDQQHGKVAFRADHGVHLDFAGHKATIAPGGIVEGEPTTLHIAHYIGRPRSYRLGDDRQEEEAKRRRRVAEEEGMVRWRSNPLCALAHRLRAHLCSRDPVLFPAAAELCAAIHVAGGGGQEASAEDLVRGCEESGEPGRFDEAKGSGGDEDGAQT